MNLLFLSYHHPESNMIGAVRVRKFAENLAAEGCSVKVVSRVGLTTYEPYAPPIEFASARGWKVMTQVNAVPIAGTMRRLVRSIVRALAPFSKVRAGRAFWRNSRRLGAWTPDIIVASGPPFFVLFVAKTIARQRKIPWVADYRDLWTLSSYYALGSVRRRLDRAIESNLLRTASFITTVSQPLADEMREVFGVRSEVVLNGYDPLDLSELATVRNVELGLPLRILYTGEIYEGKRDPTPLFVALSSLELGPEEVLVEFYGDNVHLVQDSARRHGVDHLVKCGPRVSHAKSLELQQGADVLLLLMWDNPGERGGYSGKLFEYLGMRRPILMLGFSEGVAADLIRNRKAGVIANDPKEIASAVGMWLATKHEVGSIPTLPVDVAVGLTRQEQSQRLRRLCQALIKPGPCDIGLA